VIRVIEEFCVGCGLCVVECPHDAMRLACGKAWIDQRRCMSCRMCIAICPQGAVREEVRVSLDEVKGLVYSLRGKAHSIMRKIDQLTQKGDTL